MICQWPSGALVEAAGSMLGLLMCAEALPTPPLGPFARSKTRQYLRQMYCLNNADSCR